MDECTILWCGKYQQNWENEPHCHNYFQMAAILSGSGTAYVDDQPYALAPEMIFLFSPQQVHAIHCDASSPLKMLDVKFTVASPELFRDLSGLGDTFCLRDFGRFTRAFDRIIDESARQKPYYYDMVNCMLLELLVHILRDRLGEADAAAPVEPPRAAACRGVDVGKLLQYIDFNYSHIISLEDLSALAGVNKTTLIDIFKELLGTTPIRYIGGIRLSRAKELLTNTDASVSEIAELTGFQSIHYFSRFFKAKENCTPMEYRMNNARSRYFTFSGRSGSL